MESDETLLLEQFHHVTLLTAENTFWKSFQLVYENSKSFRKCFWSCFIKQHFVVTVSGKQIFVSVTAI